AAGRARAGAEPSSIPARRGGGRGKRDPRRRSAGPCHPRAKAGMVPAVTGRAELPHGRVLLGGIVALALAVHLVGIRKDLPSAPETDEPLVVNAAVRLAAPSHPSPGRRRLGLARCRRRAPARGTGPPRRADARAGRRPWSRFRPPAAGPGGAPTPARRTSRPHPR